MLALALAYAVAPPATDMYLSAFPRAGGCRLPLVGLGGDHTVVPMAVAMAASTAVAGSAVLVLARKDRGGDEAA